MPASTESTEEVLEEHLPADESVQGHYRGTNNSGWTRTVAVTDRRIMEITQSRGSTEENVDADSALLTGENVTGVHYGRAEEEEPATGQRLLGGLIGLIGVLLSLFGFVQLTDATSEGGIGLLLFGIILAAIGYYIIKNAEDAETGDVTLSIERANVPDKHYQLPRGHVEVPREASKVVGIRHAD